jgi:hypothetical protein
MVEHQKSLYSFISLDFAENGVKSKDGSPPKFSYAWGSQMESKPQAFLTGIIMTKTAL